MGGKTAGSLPVQCRIMRRLAHATLPFGLLLPVALPCRGQEATPQSAPVVKQRAGGFFGITFREQPHDGHTVLAVSAVLADSDAEKLGFAKDDLILGVDGERLSNGDHFIRLLYGTLLEQRARRGRGAPQNARSSIDVLRDGKRIAIAGGLQELDQTPKVGDAAPDFTLRNPSGEQTVTLSQRIGKKPVVLVFGSFT